MTTTAPPLTTQRLVSPLLSALCAAHLMWARPPRAAASPSPRPSSAVIARYQTPTGTLELTYEDLVAWRELHLKLQRAEGKPVDPPRALEEELSELALTLWRAQQTPLGALSPSAQREVIRAQDRALAWAYLSERHERQLTIDTIPQRYVDLAVKSNLSLFRHPPLKRGVHLLIHTSYDLSVSTAPPTFTSADEAKVRPAAQAIYEALKSDPPARGAELQRRLSAYQATLPKGYTLRFEDLGRFPQRGRFVEPFSDACFALKPEEHLTPPVWTQFGVHIAWIDEHIPAKDTPQAELEAEVRRRILDEVRSLELNAALNADREEHVWVDEGYFLRPSVVRSEEDR